MKFEREFLNHLDKLMGRSKAVEFVLYALNSAGSEVRSQPGSDYFGFVAKKMIDHGVTLRHRVAFDWLMETFNDDRKAVWEYMRSGGNQEIVAIVLGLAFKGDGDGILWFLLQVMSDEEEVVAWVEGYRPILNNYGVNVGVLTASLSPRKGNEKFSPDTDPVGGL